MPQRICQAAMRRSVVGEASWLVAAKSSQRARSFCPTKAAEEASFARKSYLVQEKAGGVQCDSSLHPQETLGTK